MIAPDLNPPVIDTTTYICVGGVTTGYVAPTVVSAISAVGIPISPIAGSGVAAIIGCSVTFEGTPWAPMYARPTEGTSAAVGNACSAEDAVALAPLQPKMRAA